MRYMLLIYSNERETEAMSPEEDSRIRAEWEIATVYQELERVHPSAVVSLNRAVAVALSEGLETGLRMIDELGGSGELDTYYLYHAARADLQRRLGRSQEAASAYSQALGFRANAVERRYLRRRLAQL
jgi:RNA polymerase sigma-70 factor, ECF subfamily